MKRLRKSILILIIVGLISYILLSKQGHDVDSIMNLPDKVDLTIQCSDLESVLVGTILNARITNSSNRIHNNTLIKVTGYDKRGNITKEKESLIQRTIGPNSYLDKPITLPARTRRCDCIIIDSTTY